MRADLPTPQACHHSISKASLPRCTFTACKDADPAAALASSGEALGREDTAAAKAASRGPSCGCTEERRQAYSTQQADALQVHEACADCITWPRGSLGLPRGGFMKLASRFRSEPYSFTEGLFFGAFFFLAPFFCLAPFCFSAGKKERKKRGDAYGERAGPQAPKGVLGCNTLKP